MSKNSSLRSDYHRGAQPSVSLEPYEYSRVEAQTFHPQQMAYETSSLRSDVAYQSGPQLSGDEYSHPTATPHAPRTESAGYFPYQSEIASVRAQPCEERRQEDWFTPAHMDPIHSNHWSQDNYHYLITRYPTFAGNLHIRRNGASSSPPEGAWHDRRYHPQCPRHCVHCPNGSVHPRDSYVRKEFRISN